MSEKTNATRIERETARVNDLLDLMREEPNLSYAEVLSTLAARWNKSTDTVKHVFEYAQRKKLFAKKTVWAVR